MLFASYRTLYKGVLSTGFNVKTRTGKKKAKRRKVTKLKDDSDEDDEDWVPGCEEVRKQRS